VVTFGGCGGGQCYLTGLTPQETNLLKICLGDSDGNLANNAVNEVFNWDHGSTQNPHLVKFVDTTAQPTSRICNSTTNVYASIPETRGFCADMKPAGLYSPLIFDSNTGLFMTYANFPADYSNSNEYAVYTTTGYLNRASTDNLQTKDSLFSNTVYYSEYTSTDMSLDCETGTSNANCVEKGDYVMFFEVTQPQYMPKTLNIYTIEKISAGLSQSNVARTGVVLNMGTNWPRLSGLYTVYKFVPGDGEQYVDECSMRGVCDSSSALCDCFAGYTNDDCSVQNTLAK